MTNVFLQNAPQRKEVSVGVGPFYKFCRILDLPGGKPVKEFLRRSLVAILEQA